jgi:hypothetical protein
MLVLLLRDDRLLWRMRCILVEVIRRVKLFDNVVSRTQMVSVPETHEKVSELWRF